MNSEDKKVFLLLYFYKCFSFSMNRHACMNFAFCVSQRDGESIQTLKPHPIFSIAYVRILRSFGHYRLFLSNALNVTWLINNLKRSFENTASKVWKQQTQFYWVCSWEIMADATSLKPPSPGLSAILFPNKSVESYSPKGPENVKRLFVLASIFL